MEKFIPYEKLSKKEKRKFDQARRQTWGELNPVTRKPANSKAYNRRKTQDWKRWYDPLKVDNGNVQSLLWEVFYVQTKILAGTKGKNHSSI